MSLEQALATIRALRVAARQGIADILEDLPDTDFETVTVLYDEWTTGAHSLGGIVRYDGTLWQCIQAHTAVDGWEPDQTPALWVKIRDTTSDTPDEWVQPTSAVDAYGIGDRVTFQGRVWESTIDANVWEPGVYGWTAQ